MNQRTIKIFNPIQINLFLKNGATALGCGIGRRSKLYIEFIRDEHFDSLLKKWANHEFEVE